MIRNIAQKEFISALRDKRIVVSGMLVLLLLITAACTGIANYNMLQQERALAQHTADDNWQQQPDRHPHRVAHYGSYAFRPKSALSFLDFGLDTYTGTAVYLEAHQQNSANFSQVQQSGAMIRFGEMTVAFVLQLLVPLLIIFLCFGAFTQEREDGTLKVLLSQGISMQQIAQAKIVGYTKVLSLIVLPGLLMAIIFLFFTSGVEMSSDLLLRMFVFFAAYCIYFFIFIVGTVVISALHRHSGTALVTLLGIWIMACVILPKITANLGARLYTAPGKAAMDALVHAEAMQGINGHDSQNERNEAMKQSLLRQYKVETVAQLPINFEGALMAAGEEYSSQVYQQHFDKLVHIYQQQNIVSAWAGILNPYLSVRFVSMAASGSDFEHYVHFLRTAEQYRYTFVQRLNELQTTHLAHKEKTFRLSSDTWKAFPPFTYVAPDAQQAMRPHLISIAALLLWGVFIWFLGGSIINRIKPV
jgi:ABC-2 type transport system permease protein